MVSVNSVVNSYQLNVLSSKVLLFCHIVNTAAKIDCCVLGRVIGKQKYNMHSICMKTYSPFVPPPIEAEYVVQSKVSCCLVVVTETHINVV